MERIFFADSARRRFAEFGLSSFDDFFNYTKGELINKNDRRDVRRFSLGDGSDCRVFFLKRFHNPHFKDIIFASHNAGHRCSQAAYERESANLLFAGGIATYRPACIGEQFKLGIESRSFLLTEKVKAEEFKDFIAQRWNGLDQNTKLSIFNQLGKFICKIHNAKISLPDLYIWHLFIKQQSGQWNFTVIDLHRMSHNVNNKDELIKNLGRLVHSMLDKYFKPSEKKALIESYAANNDTGDLNKLIRKVEKHSAAVSAKRKPKPY